MKRLFTFIVTLLVLLLCSVAFAEGKLSPEFSQFLQSQYEQNQYEILSVSENGTSGCAILKKEGHFLLSVFTHQGDAWTTVFENPNAAHEGCSVYLDTEDLLLLTDSAQRQYYFKLDGEWKISTVFIHEEGIPGEIPATEYCTLLADGHLYTEVVYTDENENVLTRREEMPLPDILTRDEHSLAAFDITAPVLMPTGYPTDQSMTISDDILRRLFAVTVPEDYIYADGCLVKDGLQFIADKPDGSRVLLCCEYTADMTCKITESTPLPANTIIGVENFTTTLNLGLQGYGATIAKGHDGIWRVSGILGDEWFKLGSCWVSSGLLWAEANPAIGTVRQSDITCIDWTLIPKTLQSATAMLDTSDWATPNNANPQERLHLRSQADKKSRSLGKYYNGTPIKVLERGKEWTKVQIGSVTGYMMTKYLLFGEDINKQTPALAYKTNVNLITEILWDDTNTTEKLTPYEVNQLLIIGVMEDEWYLVWEPNADRYGRILQSSLWDGNG